MSLTIGNGPGIFGPGSEWFWSMAQFILVGVTLIGIYYQLRLARSANAFEQMNRITEELESERMTRHTLEILLAIREGAELVNIPEGAATAVTNFLEHVAALIRAGHVDRDLVYEYAGARYQWWWVVLAPNVRRARTEAEDPAVAEDFEWLAGVMAKMDRKTGVLALYDEARLFKTLERRIQVAQERIRGAEELRAVIIRSTSPDALRLPAPP